MSSYSRVLYVGVSGDLLARVQKHRERANPNSFTARYQITELVYFEEYPTAALAIARESQMKAYRRSKKISLIDAFNPQWVDLAAPAQIPRPLRGSE